MSGSAGSVLDSYSAAFKRKRIMFLIHSLNGGGAERMTIALARHWAEAGARVSIATLGRPGQRKYDLPGNVAFIPLSIAGTSRSPLVAILNNFKRLRRLRKLFIAERPDVVVGMMTGSAVLLALIRNRRFVAIGAERNFPASQPAGRFWPFMRKWTYARLDAVAVQTDQGRDWLLKHTHARRVVVVPNSVHLPLPINEPILPVSTQVAKGRRLLIAVGRLEQQKAFDQLVRAFASVSDDNPEWDLVILGEGALRSQLEAQIETAGLRQKVRMPGWVGNLSDWYQEADLFVMTSLFEGFPNALVEAMAHGCPVLSVDCDTGPRDIITENVDGWLVPQHDPVALIAAMDELMKDPKLRQKLGLNARKVSEIYSPERINNLWGDLLIGARKVPDPET